jgi:hypothetical protein
MPEASSAAASPDDGFGLLVVFWDFFEAVFFTLFCPAVGFESRSSDSAALGSTAVFFPAAIVRVEVFFAAALFPGTALDTFDFGVALVFSSFCAAVFFAIDACLQHVIG